MSKYKHAGDIFWVLFIWLMAAAILFIAIVKVKWFFRYHDVCVGLIKLAVSKLGKP
jgi:hypothetical protein